MGFRVWGLGFGGPKRYIGLEGSGHYPSKHHFGIMGRPQAGKHAKLKIRYNILGCLHLLLETDSCLVIDLPTVDLQLADYPA